MTPRPLTDAQLAAGLRSHLPAANAGLHGRIVAEIATTPQQRRLPTVFGRLTDADPLGRRRMMLLVALLALAAAVSVAAIAGGLLRGQRTTDLSLDPLGPPADVDAFVLGSYGKLTELPAFRLVHGPDPIVTFNYDGSGALREEANGESTIFTPDVIASSQGVSQGDWGHPLSRLMEYLSSGEPNCPTGWVHVEVSYLIERPTHHVRCTTQDAELGILDREWWIDIDTGLVLRSGSPSFQQTESGSLEPLGLTFSEVTELAFGPQPEELFVLEGAAASTTPTAPSSSAAPIITPPPADAQVEVPADLDAWIAEVHAAYKSGEPVDIRIDSARHPNLAFAKSTRWQRDGHGAYRSENDLSQDDGQPGVVILMVAGRSYETDPRGDRTWRDWGPIDGLRVTPTMGLPEACGPGWRHLGIDLVLDRPAHHVACGFQEFWVDAEWRFVTRGHDHDPLLGEDPGAGLSEVTSVAFGPQDPELFEQPAPDDLWSYP